MQADWENFHSGCQRKEDAATAKTEKLKTSTINQHDKPMSSTKNKIFLSLKRSFLLGYFKAYDFQYVLLFVGLFNFFSGFWNE